MRGALLTLLLLACGCASFGRAVLTANADQAAYRAVRLAKTREEKLAREQDYLRGVPDGAYRDEVAALFAADEPHFYESKSRGVASLRAYLTALPDGPHAAEARSRVEALDRAEAMRKEELLQTGRELERSLSEAAESRERVVGTYLAWVRRLAQFRSWGKPIDRGLEELGHEWSQAPSPECSRQHCSKILTVLYRLPQESDAQSLELEVQVTPAAGGVTRLQVSGVDLIVHLAQAYESKKMDAEDTGDRILAIAAAVSLTSNALEGILPEDRCEQEVEAPLVLARGCDGVLLQLVSGDAAGQKDTLSVTIPPKKVDQTRRGPRP